jgi:hypothetical protein
MRPVSILFARKDSIYKTLPGCDVWDEERDARKWPGGTPVVAHPPCAQWGILRSFSRNVPDIKALAPLAVTLVQMYGGVLEHPERSTLWKHCGLPAPGSSDSKGRYTLSVPQWWWGHKAMKWTWLYVVAVNPASIPSYPFTLGEPQYTCGSSTLRGLRPEVPRAEREHTPPAFAQFLVEIARSVR